MDLLYGLIFLVFCWCALYVLLPVDSTPRLSRKNKMGNNCGKDTCPVVQPKVVMALQEDKDKGWAVELYIKDHYYYVMSTRYGKTNLRHFVKHKAAWEEYLDKVSWHKRD